MGRDEQAAIRAARPSLDWLKEGIQNPRGAVWLNVGWYIRGDGDNWKRKGGHWVTLVGFGAANPGDAADSDLILIHNPATRGSDDKPDDPAKDIVRLTRIDRGTLDTGKEKTEDAAGMYQLSGPDCRSTGAMMPLSSMTQLSWSLALDFQLAGMAEG
ncbi:MAG: hypothetical protein WDO13_00775 [Verrucomicrobiota bacterium]